MNEYLVQSQKNMKQLQQFKSTSMAYLSAESDIKNNISTTGKTPAKGTYDPP